MKTGDLVLRILAVAGTVLSWLPVVAPLAMGLVPLFGEGRYRFDYLLPAELYPVATVGGATLVVAALLARRRRVLVICSLAASAVLLLGVQGIAEATGLAHGEREPVGWRFGLVTATLAVFILSPVSLGLGGVLLARDLAAAPDGAVR